MTQKQIEEMRKLDEAAERAGGYVSPFFKSDSHYDYRAMVKYCKEHKKEPLDLTIREMRQFILPQ